MRFSTPPEMTIFSTDTISTSVAQSEPSAWATPSHTGSSSEMDLRRWRSMPFLAAMARELERPSMSCGGLGSGFWGGWVGGSSGMMEEHVHASV